MTNVEFLKMLQRITFLPLLALIVGFFLVGCNQTADDAHVDATHAEMDHTQEAAVSVTDGTASAPPGMGMGMGRGPQGGMMARHHAPIPAEYAGLTNPVAADEASLERGADLYALHCASCHGDGGMGDGPAGAALDPAPAPVARTSQRMGDDYLFWRTSEGGLNAPFNSTMPAWQGVLDEQARWDVINYMQSLGSGRGPMRFGMGGAVFDPDAPDTQQAEMLAAAVAAAVLTQSEADLFTDIHDLLEALMAAQGDHARGNMDAMQASLLAELVSGGQITQAQADAFADIHDRLHEYNQAP